MHGGTFCRKFFHAGESLQCTLQHCYVHITAYWSLKVTLSLSGFWLVRANVCGTCCWRLHNLAGATLQEASDVEESLESFR